MQFKELERKRLNVLMKKKKSVSVKAVEYLNFQNYLKTMKYAKNVKEKNY